MLKTPTHTGVFVWRAPDVFPLPDPMLQPAGEEDVITFLAHGFTPKEPYTWRRDFRVRELHVGNEYHYVNRDGEYKSELFWGPRWLDRMTITVPKRFLWAKDLVVLPWTPYFTERDCTHTLVFPDDHLFLRVYP